MQHNLQKLVALEMCTRAHLSLRHRLCPKGPKHNQFILHLVIFWKMMLIAPTCTNLALIK